MQYLGNSARVPLGNGTWSKFMPIAQAVKYEHNLKKDRFLQMLRAGKTIIALAGDSAAVYAAAEEFKREREAAANTLTQAD